MGKRSAKIFGINGEVKGKARIPQIFKTPVRPDVIKRAVIALQSHRFQPQGRAPHAGKRTTAESRGVGLGISRIPRIKGGARAALAPSTVGGRRTHPPKSEKKIEKKIPKKEMRLALRSAVAATASREIVASRGHIVYDVPDFPLVVTDELQQLKKTRDVRDALIRLGVWSDVYRVKESKNIRAGRGKTRGRRKKQAVGPLIVITENEGVVEAARNLPGVDITVVNSLNAELLAPGTHSGRLTLWTNSAFETVDGMFGDN
ncbi:MAG: 50S ribosomal protein L4 [Candidatus Bathyarchaeota archaeon]|nr:MAG: 50S ribosomal protein L4 [Candidatus Bathyarchaeota archaeon]